jgi:hypothetical protein
VSRRKEVAVGKKQSGTGVERAIAHAETLLPGSPAAEGEVDRRWQAIIRVGEFIESEPEAVWAFVVRWGKHAQTDLRMAVATCLLEHLLDAHFEMMLPRVREAAMGSVRFAKTLEACWSFGRAGAVGNWQRVERVTREARRRRK